MTVAALECPLCPRKQTQSGVHQVGLKSVVLRTRVQPRVEPCYAQAIGAEPQWAIRKTVSDSRADGTPKGMLLFGRRGSREGCKVRVGDEGGLRGWRDKKGVTAQVRKDRDFLPGIGGFEMRRKRLRIGDQSVQRRTIHKHELECPRRGQACNRWRLPEIGAIRCIRQNADEEGPKDAVRLPALYNLAI